jgi:hypothetical protein
MMKLSKKRRENLYAAIHTTIINARIKLKLPPTEDFILAQVEHEIWLRQKRALELTE